MQFIVLYPFFIRQVHCNSVHVLLNLDMYVFGSTTLDNSHSPYFIPFFLSLYPDSLTARRLLSSLELMYNIGNGPEIEGLVKNKKNLMNYLCL